MYKRDYTFRMNVMEEIFEIRSLSLVFWWRRQNVSRRVSHSRSSLCPDDHVLARSTAILPRRPPGRANWRTGPGQSINPVNEFANKTRRWTCQIIRGITQRRTPAGRRTMAPSSGRTGPNRIHSTCWTGNISKSVYLAACTGKGDSTHTIHLAHHRVIN